MIQITYRGLSNESFYGQLPQSFHISWNTFPMTNMTFATLDVGSIMRCHPLLTQNIIMLSAIIKIDIIGCGLHRKKRIIEGKSSFPHYPVLAIGVCRALLNRPIKAIDSR